MSDYSNVIHQEFGGEAAQARVVGNDLDPEKAQRAVELGEATGIEPHVVAQNLEEFDQYHKASLGAHIVRNNQALKQYIDSHPMAAAVSGDDLGQLDKITDSVKALSEEDDPMAKMHKIFWEGFGESQEAGFIGGKIINNPNNFNEDGTIKYPTLTALALAGGQLLDLPLRAFGGALAVGEASISGVYSDITGDESGGRRLARDMSGMVDTYMNAFMGRTPRARQYNNAIKEQIQKVALDQRAQMYWQSGKELPIGLSKEFDAAIDRVSKEYWKKIDDLASEADKSATKERNPEFFRTFIEQHPELEGATVRVDAEAVQRLYGEDLPSANDGLLGFIPNLDSILKVGADFGVPVRVPLIDWVTKLDKDLRDVLKDDARAKLQSVSKKEAEDLKVWNQIDAFKDPEKQKIQPINTEEAAKIWLGDVPKSSNSAAQHHFLIHDENGPAAIVSVTVEGKRANIDNIQTVEEIRGGGPSSLTTARNWFSKTEVGPSVIRQSMREFLKQFPEVTEFSGNRISGARHGGEMVPVKEGTQVSIPAYDEAIRSVRQSSGLEPHSEIFDNIKDERKYGADKLKLARLDEKARQDLDINMGSKDAFDITDDKGNVVGTLQGQLNGTEYFVDWISSRGWAQSFGPKQVLQLVKELKAEYPDIKTIVGDRVSGARGGTEKQGERVTFKAQIADDGTINISDTVSDKRGPTLKEGQANWKDVYRYGDEPEEVVKALVKPKKFWKENELRISDIVEGVIAKILPEGTYRVGGAQRIWNQGEGHGVYIPLKGEPSLILWALNSTDRIHTGAHEAMHHLRQIGAITKEEWAVLEKAAIEGGWREKYKIDERYQGLEIESKLEEAIAEQFGDMVSGKFTFEEGSALGKIAAKIIDILQELRTKLKEAFGREISADDIFERARTGGMKRRSLQPERPNYTFEPKAQAKSKEEMRKQYEDQFYRLGYDRAKKTYQPNKDKVSADYVGTLFSEGDEFKLYQDDLELEGKEVADKEKAKREAITKLYNEGIKDFFEGKSDRTQTGEIKSQRPEQLELPGTTRIEDQQVFEKAMDMGLTVKRYKRLMQAIEEMRASDRQWQLEKAEAYERKKQTKEWKTEAEELEPKVTEELNALPDYRANEFFRTGVLDGEKLSKMPKLNPELIDPELVRGLPERYLSDKGMHPDDAAGLLGIDSGSSLVEMLSNWKEAQGDIAPAKFVNDLIKGEVERRMSVKHGPLSENIIDAARDHVINNAQYELIHQEVLAAALRAGKDELPISKKEMEEYAKDQFRQAPIGNVSVEEMLREMGKAQRAAAMALLDGDPVAALKWEQKRMLTFIATREAKKLEVQQRIFDRNAKHYGDREVKGIDQDYLNFVHDIYMKLGGVKLNFTREDWADRINKGSHKNLEDFVVDKMNNLLEIKADDRLLDDTLRDDPKKPPMDNLTVEQFLAANDFIKSMIKNGREEARGDKAFENAIFGTNKKAMLEQLSTLDPLEFVDAKGNRKMLAIIPGGAAHVIRTAIAAHWQMEAIFNRIDRGNAFGVFTQNVMRPLIEGSNYAATLERKYSKKLEAVEYKGNMNEKISNSIFKEPSALAEPNRTAWMTMTRENLLKVLHYWGSETGREKLSRGYNIHPDDIQRWIDSNAKKEDYEYAEAMGNVFRDLKEEIDIMYNNVAGVAPENVKLAQIVTPFGQRFDGWYTPLVPHPNAEMTKFGGAGFSGLVQRGFFRSTTANGHTMRRTSAVYPLDLSIDTNISVMKRQIYDLAMRPGLIESSRYLRDPEIRSMITSRLGREITDLIDPYIKDVANAMDHNDGGLAQLKQALTVVRSNVIGTLIGWNPGTVLKHGPTALVQSVAEVGARRFTAASTKLWMMNEEIGKMNWDFAIETSEELQRRHQHYFETLRGQSASMLGKGTKIEFMARAGAWPVAISDLASAVPLWMARFEQAVKEEGLSHGDAVYLADRAVRRAHGSTAVTNRPRVMRSEAMAFFNPLYGFFNHILNRKYEMGWQTKDKVQDLTRGNITPTEFLKFAPHLAMMLTAYVMAPSIIEELVSPLASKPDDSWGKKAGKAILYTQGSDWLIARDVAHFAVGGFDPSVGLFGPMGQATRDTVKDLTDLEKATSEENMGRTLKHTITSVGMVTGLTNAQMGRWAELAYNQSIGKDMPDGWWQWLAALRYGTTKGHSKSSEEYIEHLTGEH